MELSNQTVIITGGASGIGAETARYFAKHGAKIVIFDQNLALAQEVAAEMDGLAFQCDVSEAGSVEQAVKQAASQRGAARILIHCAGIAPAGRIVGKQGPMALSVFTQVIQINLIGTFNVMRCVAANMTSLPAIGESHERGVIINTASVAAFEGQIGQAAYSASKGGVAAMTLPAARELAQFGIRVLAIAPGLVETPMLKGLPQAVQESLAAQVPFPKRLAKPLEYAMLARHLVENPMMNGTVVRLDGALRMQAK